MHQEALVAFLGLRAAFFAQRHIAPAAAVQCCTSVMCIIQRYVLSQLWACQSFGGDTSTANDGWTRDLCHTICSMAFLLVGYVHMAEQCE